MANKKTMGGKIVLDGANQYRDDLKSINAEQKTTVSELKLASAQYKENANSAEALEKKHELLSKQIQQQGQKIDVYKQALAGASGNLQKSGDNVKDWERKLANAEKALEELKSDTNSSSDAIEKQEQTVQQAQKALEQAKAQYNQTSQSVQSWEQKLNDAQAKMFDMNSELNKNEKYMKEAKSSTNGCATSIDNFGKEVKSAEKSTSTFGDVLKANLTSQAIISGVKTLASSIKNVVTNLVSLGTETASYADNILTMATNTHISTEELQAYNYAAELIDVDLNTMTKSMAKNIKSMANAQKGTEDYVNAYKELNVAFEDGNGKLRNSKDVYWDVIDALGKVGDETEADRLAMQIFGKSAQDLNSLIAKGSKGFKELAAEAKDAGAILDEDTLSALGDTDDAFQRMTQSIEIVKRKIGVQLAPVLTDSFKRISKGSKDMGDTIADFCKGAVEKLIAGFEWIVNHGNEIKSILVGIATALVLNKAISGVTALITAFQSLKAAITAANTASTLLTSASGLGLIASLVGGIGAALFTMTSSMQETTDEMSEFLKKSQELRDESEEFKKAVDESTESFNTNINSINDEAEIAKTLVDELYKLQSQSNLTAEEQDRMSQIVDQLNNKYPELNLQLDKNKKQLNMTEEAILGVIEAQKRQAIQEATQNMYAETMKKNLEATVKLKKAQEDLKNARDEYDKKGIEWHVEYQKYEESWQKTFGIKSEAYKQLSSELEEHALNVANCNKEVENYGKTVEETQDILDGMSNTIKDFYEEQGIATEETNNATDSIDQYGQQVEAATSEVSAEYQKMYESARSSIESQMSLWARFNDDTEYSKKDLIDNLQSQIDGMKNWQSNILKISQVCSADFVQELAEMGPQAAGEIAVLASMSERELIEYENKWRERNDEIKNSTKLTMGEVKNEVKKAQEDLKKNQGFYGSGMTMGESLGQGIAKGAESYKTVLNTKVAGLCTAALEAMRKALDSHSPSRKGIKIGEDLGISVPIGMENKTKEVQRAGTRVAQASLDSISKTTKQNISKGTPFTINYNKLAKAVVTGLNNTTIQVDRRGAAKFVTSIMKG